ncbi:hypothetical protein [Haloarcula amylolytica]|uniref:hypothetical protein n=1 Tax=Haloarcula amylolytica TaxID=396317 RepID=UPI0006778401|nr:hypothetical protein [Haloarcula amylolytica]
MILLHSANESAGRHAVIVLGLLTLALLAGCLGGSVGQEGPVSLSLASDDNVTHEFEVSVVDGEVGPNAVAFHRDNQSVVYTGYGQGLTTVNYNTTIHHVRRIELPANRTRTVGTHRVPAGETKRINVTDFETGDTLVVFDRREGRVVALVAANCDESGLDFVSIIAGSARTSAAYGCY